MVGDEKNRSKTMDEELLAALQARKLPLTT